MNEIIQVKIINYNEHSFISLYLKGNWSEEIPVYCIYLEISGEVPEERNSFENLVTH